MNISIDKLNELGAKLAAEVSKVSKLVRPEGFEPTAYGLEIR